MQIKNNKLQKNEVTAGIAPAYKGFADPRLAPWLRDPLSMLYEFK